MLNGRIQRTLWKMYALTLCLTFRRSGVLLKSKFRDDWVNHSSKIILQIQEQCIYHYPFCNLCHLEKCLSWNSAIKPPRVLCVNQWWNKSGIKGSHFTRFELTDNPWGHYNMTLFSWLACHLLPISSQPGFFSKVELSSSINSSTNDHYYFFSHHFAFPSCFLSHSTFKYSLMESISALF